MDIASLYGTSVAKSGCSKTATLRASNAKVHRSSTTVDWTSVYLYIQLMLAESCGHVVPSVLPT